MPKTRWSSERRDSIGGGLLDWRLRVVIARTGWGLRRFELFQVPPNLVVAVINHFLVAPIGGQRLSQREQMFGPVVAHQRLGNDLFGGFDALITQLGQHGRIALSRQDGIDNRQSGLTHDVADNVMQLQIHLVQRLLHMVDVSRGHLHEAFPVPQQRSHRTDFLLGAIRCSQ
jgi:hypothetical protein